MTDLEKGQCENCGREDQRPPSDWGLIILNSDEYRFCSFECKARWCWKGGYPMPTKRTN